MSFVDLESYVSIRELLQQLTDGDESVDVEPYALFQRLALNLSLTLGYGFRLDGSVDNELLCEIISVERGISTLRSTSNNWQDFIDGTCIWNTCCKSSRTGSRWESTFLASRGTFCRTQIAS